MPETEHRVETFANRNGPEPTSQHQALSSGGRITVEELSRLAGAGHVYHQYTLRLAGADGDARRARDRLRELLAEAGVGSGVYYPVPVHRQPAYAEYAKVRCPEAERAADDMLSIPVHHALTDDEVETVAQAVRSA